MEKSKIEKIVNKLKDEKCTVHQKIASFEVHDGGVIIKDYCCSDFYKKLQSRFQEELDNSVKLF